MMDVSVYHRTIFSVEIIRFQHPHTPRSDTCRHIPSHFTLNLAISTTHITMYLFAHLQSCLQTFRQLYICIHFVDTLRYGASSLPLVSSEVWANVDKDALTKCCSLVHRYSVMNTLSPSVHGIGLGSEHSSPPIGQMSIQRHVQYAPLSFFHTYTYSSTPIHRNSRSDTCIHKANHTRTTVATCPYAQFVGVFTFPRISSPPLYSSKDRASVDREALVRCCSLVRPYGLI